MTKGTILSKVVWDNIETVTIWVED